MTGALPNPGFHSTRANFSPDDFENFNASSCCETSSTFTVKWLAFWKIGNPCENMPRLHSTSGGFSDTEAKELQVTPYGLPSADIAVTIVTPVPNVPSAVRKSRGSIGELSVANSLAGSAGCLGRSDIQRPQSVRFSEGRPSAT